MKLLQKSERSQTEFGEGGQIVAHPIETYSANCIYYLGLHHRPANRAMHYLGSIGAVVLLATGLALQYWWMLPAAPAWAFGLGMLGHVWFERSPPENYHYPLWALASDFRMLDLFLARRISGEFKAAGRCDQSRAVVK